MFQTLILHHIFTSARLFHTKKKTVAAKPFLKILKCVFITVLDLIFLEKCIDTTVKTSPYFYNIILPRFEGFKILSKELA